MVLTEARANSSPQPERNTVPQACEKAVLDRSVIPHPSGGVTNTSIRDALVDLVGKPIDDSNAR
jgi:hypothetical protein